MFCCLVMRKQVFGVLNTLFERKQRVNDGAFIASLLETEETSAADLMSKSQELLRRIKVSEQKQISHGSIRRQQAGTHARSLSYHGSVRCSAIIVMDV